MLVLLPCRQAREDGSYWPSRKILMGFLGQRELAAPAGISLSELSAVLLGKRRPSPSTLAKLCAAVYRLQRAEMEEAERTRSVLDEVSRLCDLGGLRHLAR